MVSRVSLLIGDREFIVDEDTLIRESDYFRALLSDRHGSREPDGKYYIDADPELFNDILRYLRRGIYPLCWNKVQGHDYIRYAALLEESKFYQIDKLTSWLQEENYLRAVTTSTSVTAVESLDNIVDMTFKNAADDTTEHAIRSQTIKVYVCPRGIPVHRGDPSRCGRQCHNAQGDERIYDEEVRLTIVKFTKKICFDRYVCTEPREDSVSVSDFAESI